MFCNSTSCYILNFFDVDLFSLQTLEEDIERIGLHIGDLERHLDKLNFRKGEIEQVLQKFQGFE